jgi:uncharacterized protein (DUF1697 family)
MKSKKYLALFRGINVGGNNLLPMKELATMFARAGCESAQTFIQSGNVIFSAPAKVVEGLSENIQTQIAKRFGFRAPIVFRTHAELQKAVAGNPFRNVDADTDRLYVMFLLDAPKADAIAALDPKRSPPDEFIVRGREIYLKYVNSAARSKLTNAYFDSKLGTVSTARNWRTVTKLLELMKDETVTPG